MAEYTVDFNGAPPASRGGSSDKIPPGLYLMKVAKVTGRDNDGKGPSFNVQMTVSRGQYEGSRINDTLQGYTTDRGSKFLIQVLHSFMLACGVNTKDGKLTFNPDALAGKQLIAEIEDNTIPANDQYPARIVSRPRAYYNLRALPDDVAKAMGIASKAPVAPVPEASVSGSVPSPVVVPAPVPVPTAVTAAEVPTQEQSVTLNTDDIDDLFK